uniref:OPT/YSL family transporter n=1 Tax=Rhodothermus marinus TaxID=29549 RepID=UPI0023428A9F
GFGSELGVALLGVGYIVGLRIATLVFAGGLISWLFGIPIYTALHGLPEGVEGYEAALQIWSTKIRYLGVGAMAVGGLWALLSLIRPIREACGRRGRPSGKPARGIRWPSPAPNATRPFISCWPARWPWRCRWCSSSCT